MQRDRLHGLKQRTSRTIAVRHFQFNVSSPQLARHGEQKLIWRIGELGETAAYAKGSVLFAEEEESSGVFLVSAGRIKLSVVSPDGKALVLGFLGPGSILGLAATLLGEPHDATAEATERTSAVFLPRSALVKLVQQDGEALFAMAEVLSRRCRRLVAVLRTIGLMKSARQRLSAFLLELRPDGEDGEVSIGLEGISQESFAQIVGLSRETASRLLSGFRRRGILEWKRSALIVRNWESLRRMATSASPIEECEPGPADHRRRAARTGGSETEEEFAAVAAADRFRRGA
jgi:CRP-like cAMP-binding protein